MIMSDAAQIMSRLWSLGFEKTWFEYLGTTLQKNRASRYGDFFLELGIQIGSWYKWIQLQISIQPQLVKNFLSLYQLTTK